MAKVNIQPLGDRVLVKQVEEKEQVKKEKRVYKEDRVFNYGDKVNHEIYGDGVVIEVTNTILTVAFNKDVGIKKILKNHKSIRRV